MVWDKDALEKFEKAKEQATDSKWAKAQAAVAGTEAGGQTAAESSGKTYVGSDGEVIDPKKLLTVAEFAARVTADKER